MIVYHYTAEDSYNEISRTKQFRPSTFSTTLDSRYGDGWYFTDLPPATPNQTLYSHLWAQVAPERIKFYLSFDIDPQLLQNTRPSVYKLALSRIPDGIIRIDISYSLNGMTVIQYAGGGRR
jgi:hypothetical protein